jgi:competence protein ComEA
VNNAKLAVIVLLAVAAGSVVTSGYDRLNAPKPVIIADAVNVPAQLPPGPTTVVVNGIASTVPIEKPRKIRVKRDRSASTAAGRTSHKKIKSGHIDINTATLDQLEELPGVGASTAQSIIDFRQQAGGFHSVDELGDIPRMGQKKLIKLLPYVSL